MSRRKGGGPTRRTLRVAGLFAGIGGIESGLHAAGHETSLLCELDPWALEVLDREFPDCEKHPDITTLSGLPEVDLVTAGFPCQDLSLAGTRAGLGDTRSGLVSEVFRLIKDRPPEFLLFENVLNLLRLGRGASMRWLLDAVEDHGYRWAYRVVDSRGFGLPQRRLRVIVLASNGDVDPAGALFSDQVTAEVDDSIGRLEPGHTYGFYWTEGRRGVGWAKDSVPPIKGGSGLGIPSPPAVFDPNLGTAGTPTIRDAERLQGFQPGWTDVTRDGSGIREGMRWRMVGNAVSVPLARWLGDTLAEERTWTPPPDLAEMRLDRPLPRGGFGSTAGRYVVDCSTHVEVAAHKKISDFLEEPLKPLSPRALSGYVRRADSADRKWPDGFLEALKAQAEAA